MMNGKYPPAEVYIIKMFNAGELESNYACRISKGFRNSANCFNFPRLKTARNSFRHSDSPPPLDALQYLYKTVMLLLTAILFSEATSLYRTSQRIRTKTTAAWITQQIKAISLSSPRFTEYNLSTTPKHIYSTYSESPQTHAFSQSHFASSNPLSQSLTGYTSGEWA